MKKTTFLIVGKHAVLEALKNPSRKIDRVFVTEDAQKKLNRENQSLNLFKKLNVFYKSRKELDNLCGRDETAHQGLVAVRLPHPNILLVILYSFSVQLCKSAKHRPLQSLQWYLLNRQM
jgi:tRNA G18 (ribose-2'-O)-methylase SpoU